jgi:polygalacturonase
MNAKSHRRPVRGRPLRIDLQRRRLLIALPLAVASGPVWAVAQDFAPRRQRGGRRIDVRGSGARGDGMNDDTAAFQRAIDSLPEEGGTVVVPAGDYLIDPTRRVVLRSRMHLELDPGAVLVAKPNAADRAYVLEVARISDVEISGGRIRGDRDGHLGTTGEWGHGIAIYGARRVTVRDIQVSRCWGDGIAIGGKKENKTDKLADPSEDVVLANVVSTGNRRQALTIGHSRDVRVHDCRFSDTAGTAPECGIDLEPDPPWDVRRARIENCRIDGNRGSGIQLFKRVHDVTIRGCTIENNHGYGVLAVQAAGGTIEDNDIRDNGYAGVVLRARTRDFRIGRNRFRGNSLRRRAGARRAKLPVRAHVRYAEDTSGITLAGNQFLDGAGR